MVGPAVAVILTKPQLAHYILGWPRAEDFGVVAPATADPAPVGAAWARTVTADVMLLRF